MEEPIVPTDFPIERLGWENFERMAVALLRIELGAQLEAFGRGRDGGREATYHGDLDWSRTTSGGSTRWTGYTVFQAKFHINAGRGTKDDEDWLKSEIRKELLAWRTGKRAPVPDNIVFITNARLSSVPTTGGIDSVARYLKEQLDEPRDRDDPSTSLRAGGLNHHKVIHRDTLIGQLNGNGSVRLAFNLISEADLLQRWAQSVAPADPDEMRAMLVDHGEAALKADRLARFSVSGSSTRAMPLSSWVVDLPGTMAGQRVRAMARIVRRSSLTLRRSLVDSEPRHLVLTGSPGNGKTTIAAFLGQYMRAMLLQHERLSATATEVVHSTLEAANQMGLPRPPLLRWPLTIDLPALAEETYGTDASFLNWVAHRISQRTAVPVTAAFVQRWLRHSPSLFVFDGLDEVTVPEARSHVLQTITDFVDDADKQDLDVFVVVTTRPTGYTDAERLPEADFAQLDLVDLNTADADSYATHVLAVLLEGDPEGQARVKDRLRAVVAQRGSERLTRTPLQVVILLLILEDSPVLPPDRYSLFWRYFETVYEREAAKNTGFKTLFSVRRDAIESVHSAVGLLLHAESQAGEEIVAELSKERFQNLVSHQLRRLGHPEGSIARITREITELATKRLVLLVPTAAGDGVMFEIRSLQELMAARALTEGTDDQIRSRLLLLSPNPNWRNTWIFMAGRVFSDRQRHRYDIVTEVVEQVDEAGDWPGWACPVGPSLAANLLDDGMVGALPAWKSRLVDVALRSVQGPFPTAMRAIHQGLLSAAAQDSDTQAQIRKSFMQFSDGPPINKRFVQWLMRRGDLVNAVPGIGLATFDGDKFWPDPPAGSLLGPAKHILDPVVTALGVTSWFQGAGRDALDAIGRLFIGEHEALGTIPTRGSLVRPNDGALVAEALRDPNLRLALQLVIDELPSERWAILFQINWLVEPHLTRRPIPTSALDMSTTNDT